MGQAGLKRVINKYKWEDSILKMEEVYLRLI